MLLPFTSRLIMCFRSPCPHSRSFLTLSLSHFTSYYFLLLFCGKWPGTPSLVKPSIFVSIYLPLYVWTICNLPSPGAPPPWVLLQRFCGREHSSLRLIFYSESQPWALSWCYFSPRVTLSVPTPAFSQAVWMPLELVLPFAALVALPFTLPSKILKRNLKTSHSSFVIKSFWICLPQISCICPSIAAEFLV